MREGSLEHIQVRETIHHTQRVPATQSNHEVSFDCCPDFAASPFHDSFSPADVHLRPFIFHYPISGHAERAALLLPALANKEDWVENGCFLDSVTTPDVREGKY